MVDAEIAHGYGLGYPCMIENASGGACGMAAFGAVFPSFEPGFVYTTPKAGGFELSVGVYDPANVANGQMNRTPYPRLEGEAYVRDPGRRQALRKRILATLGRYTDRPRPPRKADGRHRHRAGRPSRLHGDGRSRDGRRRCLRRPGLQPDHLRRREPSNVRCQISSASLAADFGLGAFTFESIHLKVAGGAGVFHFYKTVNDPIRSPPPARLGTRSCSSKTWGLRQASTRRPDPCTLLWSISEPSTPSTSTARRIRTTRPSSTSRNPRKR